jgi:hypothetical protein
MYTLATRIHVALPPVTGWSSELSVAELALRKRVRESAWFDNNYLDFRAPFAAADVSGSGRLSIPQFQEAVARLGVAMSPQELSNLARRLDANADGTIDYYEFAKLVDLDPSELCVSSAWLSIVCCDVTMDVTIGCQSCSVAVV